MIKLLIILFSISLIGCCNEQKLLKNGLTKEANKTTVYSIRIKSDSINNKVQDTLSIKENYYNSNNQISSLFERTFWDNETVEIQYIYNDLNKLKSEIVKMSTDSVLFKVNYIYKDSMLNQSKSIFEDGNEIFEQVATYYYRKNGFYMICSGKIGKWYLSFRNEQYRNIPTGLAVSKALVRVRCEI